MTDKKISELTNITGANVDDANDELTIVDSSEATTKAITRGELFSSVSSLTTTGNLTVGGDLTVNGTTVTIDTTTLDVSDKNITVAKDAPDAATADGAGLTVDGANATFTYVSAGDNWAFNKDVDVTGDITLSGTVDGRDVAADGTKLDGIVKTTSSTDGTPGRIPQFFNDGGIFGLGANLAPTQDDFDATSKRSGFSRTTSITTNIGSIPAGSSFGMSFVFSYDSNNFREIWGDVLDDGGLWTRKYRDVTGGYGDWHSFLLMNASTGEGTHGLGVDQSVGTSDNFSYSIKTNATVRLTVSSAGDVSIGDHEADSKLDVDGAITQRPLSADPADPADGHSVQWVSDGTGSGDAGDVMMKINVGGTVKTTTLVDYSTL